MKYYPMPTSQSTAQAVILANGDFPSHPIPKAILHHNQKKLVCCDGAANHLLDQGLIPQIIIGDCDSLSLENQIKYEKIIIKIPEQNTNDLTKAVNYCKNNALSSLIILGATGKREDHTIANISLLAKYISIIEIITMITDHGFFHVIQHPSQFQSIIGQQVSLFSVQPTAISTSNLKYPLDQQNLLYWWQGTLNESLSDHFDIQVNSPLIVYQAFVNPL
ncbi:thiamine diphosphokinase [Commensalibacter papalotli (ex Botero et al. 2024)]|nr:thiamine diphosphokinase [Commensalibacter papalotli (ex Botero et al. 2024)]